MRRKIYCLIQFFLITWFLVSCTNNGGSIPNKKDSKPIESVKEIKTNSADNGTKNIVEISNDEKKLSISEAEKLVREYIFKQNSEMKPEAIFPLRETTTKEIYDKLHAQTFKVKEESHMANQDYIIKGRVVNSLGSYWGGFGIDDMKVVDLNNDGRNELVYHYWTGSGISRSIEGVYYGPNNIKEKLLNIIPKMKESIYND